ncbi:aminotransferase class I/II-fold pyridoxal phosphate-dependent enzyme [Flavobacterium sp. UBA6135]|uniref:aminotransferase class I/II-fold pyridoxal phosphate-dependent enzyme n=1 Tax=Flavobacterium sp. UBA6135 TaxID=1946553 RepID=UPI0025BA8AB1|nr:pyridoxal phosphate-dependent aminotransferase family protein [Flavobacterium sp. UBA6135]
MKSLPSSLLKKLEIREQNASLRKLPVPSSLIDFSSNDYLGFANNEEIFHQTHELLITRNLKINGATGSRLLSGNHALYTETEEFIAQFHQTEAALIFNSGYDANVGFFSSVPQRNDIILYDELCHASIRDGIQMSLAKSYKFTHNDLSALENLLSKFQPAPETLGRNPQPENIFIVTESIFSMDGDSPDLEQMIGLTEKYNAYFVVDEAHALGVIGENGEGLVQNLQLQDKVFARIMTFGKALGCHGAAVLGSLQLKNYLINFARSFIYTTGMSPHAVATIWVAYQQLSKSQTERVQLIKNSTLFDELLQSPITQHPSPIKSILFSGNERVKNIAYQLQQNGFDVKPILSPTVPEGKERLRFCIHSYNTEKQIFDLLALLS